MEEDSLLSFTLPFNKVVSCSYYVPGTVQEEQVWGKHNLTPQELGLPEGLGVGQLRVIHRIRAVRERCTSLPVTIVCPPGVGGWFQAPTEEQKEAL